MNYAQSDERWCRMVERLGGLYFASGSGRSWICTARGFEPLPPSISHGVRSPFVLHSPRPFHPAFGSSMRPSKHLRRRRLLLQRVAQLVEQAGILDGDHRLAGEVLHQFNLLVGERAHLLACSTEISDIRSDRVSPGPKVLERSGYRSD
jgi:hypothetical protein